MGEASLSLSFVFSLAGILLPMAWGQADERFMNRLAVNPLDRWMYAHSPT